MPLDPSSRHLQTAEEIAKQLKVTPRMTVVNLDSITVRELEAIKQHYRVHAEQLGQLTTCAERQHYAECVLAATRVVHSG